MKTWTDVTQFAVLCKQGRIGSVKVQVVEGGYALFFCLDKSREEEPLLKARTKNVRVWANLDTLIHWVVENTNLKTLTISLEKPP